LLIFKKLDLLNTILSFLQVISNDLIEPEYLLINLKENLINTLRLGSVEKITYIGIV